MARKTTMSSNGSHAETEEFITQTHVMPILWDDEVRERIIGEHRKNPIGTPGKAGKPGVQHSEELGHLLDKLRRHPSKGKECMVAIKPFEKYAIGILPGVRGAQIEILDGEYYATEDECEHAIFLRRIKKMLSLYPRPST
jgi:hypothetical protein